MAVPAVGPRNFTQKHGDSDAAPTLMLYNLFPPSASPLCPVLPSSHTPTPRSHCLFSSSFLLPCPPRNVASTWLANKARGIQELQDYTASPCGMLGVALWNYESWRITGRVRARGPDMSQKFQYPGRPRNIHTGRKGIRGEKKKKRREKQEKKDTQKQKRHSIYDPIERVIICFLCLGRPSC